MRDSWAADRANAPSARPPTSPDSTPDPGTGWNDATRTTWNQVSGPQPRNNVVADSWNSADSQFWPATPAADRSAPAQTWNAAVPDSVPPSWSGLPDPAPRDADAQPTTAWTMPRDVVDPGATWQKPAQAAPGPWVRQSAPFPPQAEPAVPPPAVPPPAVPPPAVPPATAAHGGALPAAMGAHGEASGSGRRVRRNPKVALVTALVAAALGGAGVGAGVTAALSGGNGSASVPAAPGNGAPGQDGAPGQAPDGQAPDGQVPTAQASQGT